MREREGNGRGTWHHNTEAWMACKTPERESWVTRERKGNGRLEHGNTTGWRANTHSSQLKKWGRERGTWGEREYTTRKLGCRAILIRGEKWANEKGMEGEHVKLGWRAILLRAEKMREQKGNEKGTEREREGNGSGT